VNESVDVIYVFSHTSQAPDAYINDKWNILIRKFGVLMFGLLFLALGIIFGRVFWNRDSMYIGVAYSKSVDLAARTNKNSDT
jgi:hypothetical protein